MNIVRHILSKVNLLVVTYKGLDNYSMRLLGCVCSGSKVEITYREEIDDLRSHKNIVNKNPIIVIACGFGIITKDGGTAQDIVIKVTSDNENFLWSRSQSGQLSFVRRTQIITLIEQLRLAGAKIVDTICVDIYESTSDCLLKQLAATFVASLKWRNISTPTPTSSIILQIVCSHIMLPLLSIILALLIANFFIGERVQILYRQQHCLLVELEQQSSQTQNLERSGQQLLEEFNTTLPYCYAWLCDRIALHRPDDLWLTTLALQPLMKQIENGKSPLIIKHTILIRGTAQCSEDVALYTSQLKQEKFANNLKLISLDMDSGSGLLLFQIEIAL